MSMNPQTAARAGLDAGTSLVSEDVRRHNLAMVTEFLARQGPASRSQIADGTGLTRGAVTALTKLLLEAGVLREVTRVLGGKGRPLTLLELAAVDVAVVALQLDADQAVAMAANVAGEVLFRISEHHGRPMGDPEAVLDVLAGVLDRALDEVANLGRRVAGFTVVVFAPVAGDPPVVAANTDLGWDTVVDVLGGLRSRVPRMPEAVAMRSDAGLAAFAELSKLDGVRDMVYLKSNSGIGGAAVVDGRLLTGAHGFAGAFGHFPIDHGGTRCVCGQSGCLVLVAGPDVVLAAAGLGKELKEDGLTSALAELVRRIDAGDKKAMQAWGDASVWIARALRLLTRTLDPEVVLLGGYWADLADSLRAAFDAQEPAHSWPRPEIRPGRLGVDAALLGALWSARAALLQDPLALT